MTRLYIVIDRHCPSDYDDGPCYTVIGAFHERERAIAVALDRERRTQREWLTQKLLLMAPQADVEGLHPTRRGARPTSWWFALVQRMGLSGAPTRPALEQFFASPEGQAALDQDTEKQLNRAGKTPEELLLQGLLSVAIHEVEEDQ